MLERIYLLIYSDIDVLINFGCPEYVSVRKLDKTMSRVAIRIPVLNRLWTL
jgi:hypothetical protein